MAIPNMSDEQMRLALKELEQATYNHDQWAEAIFSALICRLTPDERDVRADTHHMCRFGQWFYRVGIAALRDHAGFAEIGHEHERMHQYAAGLLRSSVDGEPISIKDFDRFVNARKRLQLEIATVRRELEVALFNLDPLTGTPSRIGMLSTLREQQEFEELASLPFGNEDKGHFQVTVSFGLTFLDPDSPVEKSIDRADRAL